MKQVKSLIAELKEEMTKLGTASSKKNMADAADEQSPALKVSDKRARRGISSQPAAAVLSRAS